MSQDVFRAEYNQSLPEGARAVLFDAGNTLTYLDAAWIAGRLRDDGWDTGAEAIVYGQNVAAYEASRMALLKRYPTDADRLIPYFSRILELAGIPEGFSGECARTLHEEHKANFLWRHIPDFVLPTLKELRARGYILGVVSNSDGRLRPVLDGGGLTQCFEFIIDSAVVGVEKPNPEIFKLATEAAETSARKCVYVGDIYAVDIEGARRAGIAGVLLDPLSLHGEYDCVRIAKLPQLLSLLPPLKWVTQS